MELFLKILVIFNTFIYGSYAYLYLYSLTNIIKPLHWFVITIGSAFLIAIISRFRMLSQLPGSVIVWVWVFSLLTVISTLRSSQSEVVIQALITRIEMIAILCSFLIMFVIPNGIRMARIALLLVVLISVPLNIIDFFQPTWSKDPGRAAGMYVVATTAGMMLVGAMVASIPTVPSKLRLLYCVFVGIGVLVTFSRGAWILWGIALVGLTAAGYFNVKRKAPVIVVMGLFSSLVVYALLSGQVLNQVANTQLSEYLSPGAASRLGDDEFKNKDGSAEGTKESRIKRIKTGWNLFSEKPWFGWGMASYQYRRPHNMYALMIAEDGIVGLAIYLGLFTILWRITDSSGKVLVVVILVASNFSHGYLEQPAMFLFYALIASAGKLASASDANELRAVTTHSIRRM